MLKHVVLACCEARVHLSRQLSPGLTSVSAQCMSTDTHDDFKPEIKQGLPLSAEEAIRADIKANKVMVYMKGYPEQPMCGFSGRVVALMNGYGVKFASKNVLEDDELREGIKRFSNWPTIPQVFVNGEFVGGCDILWDAHESGEFPALMDSAPPGGEGKS